MPAQTLTFYTDATHSQNYSIPYLGDITGYPEGNPVMDGIADSLQNLRAIKFGTTFETGRRNVSFMLYESGAQFTIYSTPSLTYGLWCHRYDDKSQVEAPGGGWIQVRTQTGRTQGMCLGLAKVNGTMRLGIVIWGTSWQSDVAEFCYSYDSSNLLNVIYDTITRKGDPFNPYSGGGYTGPGGGGTDKDQNFEDLSDSVGVDPLPTIGALNSHMVTVFSPTALQLQNLGDFLFSYNFFDWLQKNLQNLDELFVSLGTVPFETTKGSTESITFLGFDISSFTHPINLTKLGAQYYEFDMGSIAFDGSDGRIHTSDSVFDYSPYSTLGIYLPFIGFQELDIDEVRNTTLNLKYRIDVVSGSCLAIIRVTDERGYRDVYQFSGNCLTQIPLGSVDMSGIVSGSIQIATAALSAGSTAAIASAGDAAAAGFGESGLSAAQQELRKEQRSASVSNANASLASTTANSTMGMKPNYRHTGAIGNSCAMFAVKQPYLFLKTPNEAVPEGYEKYCGFPSNITARLGDLSGYTVVEDIRLNGLVATSPEVEEIYTLLKSGVII